MSYLPEYDQWNVGYCSHEHCPEYDGKRCKLTGFLPNGVCQPWAIDAANALAALPDPSPLGVEEAMDGIRELINTKWDWDECESTARSILTRLAGNELRSSQSKGT